MKFDRSPLISASRAWNCKFVVRYGIIGAGMMGAEHIRNISLLEDASVAGLADSDPSMLEMSAELAGGRGAAYSDYRDLLAADICDAYVVATPNDTHHDIMLDVLEAKKPILCEKPLCTTSTDCRSLIKRAEILNVPVWVAMEYRFMPPLARMLERMRSGEIGNPVMLSIREHRFPFLQKVGNWNRFNRRTGGTLVEKCCHFWDLMRLMLQSDPVRVFASAGSDVNHKDELYDGEFPDILDNAFAVVEFANGTRGMLDLCMFAEGGDWQNTVSVVGSSGRMEARVPATFRFSAGKLRHSEIAFSDRTFRPDAVEQIPVDSRILEAGEHHGSTFFQHQGFYDLVRKGSGKPAVSLRDGLWSVVLGEAAECSARTGRSCELK
ncbi:MAG: Gfo/Idh/MocA family oxidoreductase [Albidovulum sp.]|nr:Gfo/Idh/MocA family oxidoreductase [Albidovulum sp.]